MFSGSRTTEGEGGGMTGVTPRVVLFGTLIPDDEVKFVTATSEAANRFQGSLLRSVSTVRPHLAVSLVPMPAFPRGPWRTFEREWQRSDLQIGAPGFINLPVVKRAFIHASTLRHVRWRFPDARDMVVLSYNATIGQASAARRFAAKRELPFAVLVADLQVMAPEKMRRDRLVRWMQRRELARADGIIVMSEHVINDLALEVPHIVITGAIEDDWNQLPMVEVVPGRVTYAGALIESAGVDRLLTAFSSIDGQGLELVIAGRGPLEEHVRAASERDSRIKYLGFMSRDEMKQVLVSSTLLVNPRPEDAPESRYNFPSKLHEYMASGRPVLTTITGGMSGPYIELNRVVPDSTSEAISTGIRAALAAPRADLDAQGEKSRKFALANLTWEQQGRRIREFLITLCTGNRFA